MSKVKKDGIYSRDWLKDQQFQYWKDLGTSFLVLETDDGEHSWQLVGGCKEGSWRWAAVAEQSLAEIVDAIVARRIVAGQMKKQMKLGQIQKGRSARIEIGHWTKFGRFAHLMQCWSCSSWGRRFAGRKRNVSLLIENYYSSSYHFLYLE